MGSRSIEEWLRAYGKAWEARDAREFGPDGLCHTFREGWHSDEVT